MKLDQSDASLLSLFEQIGRISKVLQVKVVWSASQKIMVSLDVRGLATTSEKENQFLMVRGHRGVNTFRCVRKASRLLDQSPLQDPDDPLYAGVIPETNRGKFARNRVCRVRLFGRDRALQ